MTKIITNTNKNNSKNELVKISSNADRIDIAVAFFSYSELIKQWENENKKVKLIVSLRPPTNYYSLKNILASNNVEINFLGKEFHSKFFIFYKEDIIIGAVLGSSNFTSGGLINNKETNVIIDNKKTLLDLQKHFQELLDESNLLQPNDLDEYEKVYKNFMEKQKVGNKELDKFLKKIINDRAKRKEKTRINKDAKQFYEFWKNVDKIKDLVKSISEKEYPNVPQYLVLDHFWHYIKVEWYKENEITLNKNNREIEIPKIFRQYIKWQKTADGGDYPKQMFIQSKKIFQVYLSKKNIDVLSKTQAKEIFKGLHSSNMPIKRFSADDLFISQNDIRKIRKSLKYLLYSNDDMSLKIHNLMKNSNYKLDRLGSSGIQEINGWTNPNVFPIRNDKADKAIEILGYRFK